MGFLELRNQCGFSHEVRRGSQGASPVEPGKSGLHVHGEGELVITLKSWEMTRASRRVEEALSRSFSGGGGTPSCIIRKTRRVYTELDKGPETPGTTREATRIPFLRQDVA